MYLIFFFFLTAFSFQAVSADQLLEYKNKQRTLEGSDLHKSDLSSDLSRIVEDIQRSLSKEDRQEAEEVIRDIDIKSRADIFSRLMLLGHKRSLYRKIEEIMRKLSLHGEPDYIFKVSGLPIPNAQIYPTKHPPYMMVFFGLLVSTSNEDELASVIAHEMTHGHFQHLKANVDDPQIKDMLNTVHGYRTLKPEQREEIRADLGVIDRLIKAGYNPWAYYNWLKKMNILYSQLLEPKILGYINKFLFERSLEYLEAHPALEIRSSAVKSYILFRGLKEDLSEQVKTYQRFGVLLNLLRKRAQVLSFFTSTVWGERIMLSYLGLFIFSGFYGLDLDIVPNIGLFIPDVLTEFANTVFDYLPSIDIFIPNMVIEFTNNVFNYLSSIELHPPEILIFFDNKVKDHSELVLVSIIPMEILILSSLSTFFDRRLQKVRKTQKRHNQVVHQLSSRKNE